MRTIDKAINVVVFLLAFAILLGSIATAGNLDMGKVKWIKYDQALEKAKKEKKHLIVDFSTSWCGYCKKMAATTYQDSQVVATIEKDFVPAIVDGDSYDVIKLKDGDITEKGLTLQFGIGGYPTTWFLEPDGKKIDRIPGYVDARSLSFILDYVRTNSNDKMTFKEFVEKQTLSKTSSK